MPYTINLTKRSSIHRQPTTLVLNAHVLKLPSKYLFILFFNIIFFTDSLGILHHTPQSYSFSNPSMSSPNLVTPTKRK